MIPLLHIGDSARLAISAEPRVLVACTLLVALALVWIWVPRSTLRRLPRLLSRPATALLLAAAVLPAVLPYDHILVRDEHAGEHHAAHASHCHDTPGSCADAPVTSGPGGLLDAAPLLLEPSLASVVQFAALDALTGIALRPDLRPPLSSPQLT